MDISHSFTISCEFCQKLIPLFVNKFINRTNLDISFCIMMKMKFALE